MRYSIVIFLTLWVFTTGLIAAEDPEYDVVDKVDLEPVHKSEAEWKRALSEEEFRILREEGTERPGTSDLLNEKRAGLYVCAGCHLPLFASITKFDSGTGWPSFYAPLSPKRIELKKDGILWMARTEVECARCNGHLGHVFKDGPEPTGLRYCLNGMALDFEPLAKNKIPQGEPKITRKDIEH